MAIRVYKPGLLSTIQDLGRFGYQKYGVIVSGAMDSFAHRVANLLVGNEEWEASIEMTLLGPTLYFEESALIAICGADLSPQIDGTPVPLWRPVLIPAGTTLKFGAARVGCRAYLAVAGGFNLVKQMDSYSTYLRAGIGGFHGKALHEGDWLPTRIASLRGRGIAEYVRSCGKLSSDEGFAFAGWHVSYELMPDYTAHPEIRIIPGEQYELFDEASLSAFFTSTFTVQPQSDRMGYRLAGEPLQLKERQEMVSAPVTFGTIQVPSDGNPIILMADRQTTGGYPKIAQVITADLPLLAQAQTGSQVRFRLIDLQEAQYILLRLKHNLDLLRTSIRMVVQQAE